MLVCLGQQLDPVTLERGSDPVLAADVTVAALFGNVQLAGGL
jgi:hypothetical protein